MHDIGLAASSGGFGVVNREVQQYYEYMINLCRVWGEYGEDQWKRDGSGGYPWAILWFRQDFGHNRQLSRWFGTILWELDHTFLGGLCWSRIVLSLSVDVNHVIKSKLPKKCVLLTRKSWMSINDGSLQFQSLSFGKVRSRNLWEIYGKLWYATYRLSNK